MTASPDENVLIRLENAGHRAGGRWLVRGVEFTIRRGEIVTLIGPNGSGKSTSAKMATGVLKPSEGRVHRARSLRIGYVPQRLAIDWTLPLTVRRLMNLTAWHSSVDVAAALEEVRAGHLLDASVQTLSGGEFQRVLMARAIVGKPDLLVLDEPVQGVDFSGEVAIYDLIKHIRDRTQCGVLLISHDLHVVMADTDQVICLNGHVCCRGTPQSVAQSPEYLSLFGGRASNSLAVYQHYHDHVHHSDGSVAHAADHTHGDHTEAHHGHDHA